LVALLVSYVEPTVWTVRASTRGLNVLTGVSQGAADNYGRVFEGGYWGQVGFALSLAVVPLLAAVVVAPLLAYAAVRAGRVGLRAARLVLAVPLALYAPVGVAAAWRLAEPAGASPSPAWVRGVCWLATAGLVCALATTAHLAALSGPGARRASLMVTGALAALAVLAVAFQAFTFPLVAGYGAGPDAAITPLVAQHMELSALGRGGVAAAYATLSLALLAVPGIAAAALLVWQRVRLDVAPPERSGPPSRVAALVLAAGLLGLLAVVVAGHRPWFARIGDLGPDPARTLLVTWLPPLVSTVVGVSLATLAAFGIGALRPLGRWSELLLLPFAPWLFVGVGPLVPRAVFFRRHLGILDEWWALIPPTWLAIPALFLLTLVFAGLADRADRVVAALPMVGLAFVATWVVQAQSLAWPLAMFGSGDRWPAPVAIYAGLEDGSSPVGLAEPLPLLLVLFLAAVAAQVWYGDRLSLRVASNMSHCRRRQRSQPERQGAPQPRQSY